ncbi:MAG: prolyl oligopeptidase family serine peptidase [Zymomonas mobilis]|mgnify:CR=1 FL=1|uniref:prolyl oligopeptidase family serine peptidase n=1 Tax=Zymomonas mobilis TaxID=542 RepID=UPI0001B707AF|nr:prolyl oligopeptidase family serine peptidase [Zymomonas mobilis]ACV76148.1 peptidase-like protein [Zymomonas mobilis subsp. mobilis NCIMB 11163]
MTEVSRRNFVAAGATLAGALLGAQKSYALGNGNGFRAAAPDLDSKSDQAKRSGIQRVYALCEVTGGGEKVYGIAIEYDSDIDASSLKLDSYKAAVYPVAKGFFAGMPQEPDKNQSTEPAKDRSIVAIYTNDAPQLGRNAAKNGSYVIIEFAHDSDLSLPTADSDRVVILQNKAIKSVKGSLYPPSKAAWSNSDRRGNHVVIRGVDDWEQNHWWWDDTRSAWLEYSIYLPKSFLKAGGERQSYPLLLAITHSGTSYDESCAQTLTEQCIASLWSLPEEQAEHECVVITPRYERTTMNDYWEHTYDVENTYKLVESLLKNTWNYGNPNLEDRRDKVLKIDPKRVYCTGWSMGAMTSLWLMAKHPDTFAAGLIIAGQQRPSDVRSLARQKLLIITGTEDHNATPWNEKCVPVWREAGGVVIRPEETLDPSLIFPVDNQKSLTHQINSYLDKDGNITFLTFKGVDHMASARKFFYIKAARDWLFKQVKK